MGHDQLLAFGLGGGGQFQVVAGDLQGVPQERLGPGVVPLRMEQRRQVAQAFGGGGVALAQHLLADRQGLLEAKLGGGIVPLRRSSSARLFRLVA